MALAGKVQADAAAAAGVEVFIFSTLEEIEHRVQACNGRLGQRAQKSSCAPFRVPGHCSRAAHNLGAHASILVERLPCSEV